MVYVLKQKFNIADLAQVNPVRARVLLVLEEQLLGEIYRRHFFSHGFEAELAQERDLLRVTDLLKTSDLVVMDFSLENHGPRLQFLKWIRQGFPRISVITVGHALEDSIMNRIMDAGVAGHVDRKFSRPMDIIEIAKTLTSH